NMSVEGLFVHGGDLWRLNTPLSCLQPPQQGKTHKQGVGRRMREGIDDKAFPEQGAKVSIHSDGSFEGLGCVLANTNLNVLTAVFYWFTLKRDEPEIRLANPATAHFAN
ncbi:hypothetical protein ACB358_18215, partial [Serratia nevei]